MQPFGPWPRPSVRRSSPSPNPTRRGQPNAELDKRPVAAGSTSRRDNCGDDDANVMGIYGGVPASAAQTAKSTANTSHHHRICGCHEFATRRRLAAIVAVVRVLAAAVGVAAAVALAAFGVGDAPTEPSAPGALGEANRTTAAMKAIGTARYLRRWVIRLPLEHVSSYPGQAAGPLLRRTCKGSFLPIRPSVCERLSGDQAASTLAGVYSAGPRPKGRRAPIARLQPRCWAGVNPCGANSARTGELSELRLPINDLRLSCARNGP